MKNTMKNVACLLCMTFILTAFAGCGKEAATTEEITTEITTEATTEATTEEVIHVIDVSKIRAVSELASLRCYYHNLAKSEKEPGTGIIHIGEKSRKFWIEYVAIVEITYNAEQMKIEQDGKDITITLPEPNINCWVEPDSWDKEKIIEEKDQWIQTNPITAEDGQKSITTSLNLLKEDVANNSTILATAENQARSMIESYIYQLGELTDTDYNIIWVTERVDE